MSPLALRLPFDVPPGTDLSPFSPSHSNQETFYSFLANTFAYSMVIVFRSSAQSLLQSKYRLWKYADHILAVFTFKKMLRWLA